MLNIKYIEPCMVFIGTRNHAITGVLYTAFDGFSMYIRKGKLDNHKLIRETYYPDAMDEPEVTDNITEYRIIRNRHNNLHLFDAEPDAGLIGIRRRLNGELLCHLSAPKLDLSAQYGDSIALTSEYLIVCAPYYEDPNGKDGIVGKVFVYNIADVNNAVTEGGSNA